MGRRVESKDARLELAGTPALDVRRVQVREALNEPFDVSLLAASSDPSLPLDAPLAKAARFVVDLSRAGGEITHRSWSGVCAELELLRGEPTGESLYRARVVPRLWLLSQQTSHRVFQRKTLPEIVVEVLADWKIEPKLELSETHLETDYAVQFGETDLAFVSRLLETAGITYRFVTTEGDTSILVLTDRPRARSLRPGCPLPFVASPNRVGLGRTAGEQEHVTRVRMRRTVVPGSLAIRDFDHRRRPDFDLVGKGGPAPEPEGPLEHYRYEPGHARWLEPADALPQSTPAADDKGRVRHSPAEATKTAERRLEAERTGMRRVRFGTNVLDLGAGDVVSLSHPRSDLEDQRLLVGAIHLDGTATEEWQLEAEATFASDPYRPPLRTPRPLVRGVHSATVVGPPGEEIHTDEHGRVRVQFPWDRQAPGDDDSSRWMRVVYPWAGAGFGWLMLPRVGQEVLVGYLEGNPDQPLVVGRLYNGVQRVPYPLPEHETRSTWKSGSTPGAEGHNEILYEDAADREILYVQAQRDRQMMTKRHAFERTGRDDKTVVGGDRAVVVQNVDATMFGGTRLVQMMSPADGDKLRIHQQQVPSLEPKDTRMEMRHHRIVLTTGRATVAFNGAAIQLEAEGTISIESRGDVVFEGKQVRINSGPPPPAPEPDTPHPPDPGTFEP